MILIVGVTGVLGRETALQLLAAGYKVRGLTRFPEHAADLKKLGVEVVQGDLIDKATLENACRDADAVLASAHQLLGTGKYTSKAVDDIGHHTLIDVAKAAGVKHFVYTSGQNASPDHPVDFYRTKAKVEAYLKQSGLSYTILRPPAFMEWHVHNLLGKSIVETGKTTIYGSGDNPTNFMAGRDVAHFAVLALTNPRMKNRVIEMGGPDNMTKNEVARLYGTLTGRTPQVTHVPTTMMKAMAPLMRALQPVTGRMMTFAVWGDTTDQTYHPDGVSKEFPTTLMHVEDFVRDRVKGKG